MRGSEIRGEMPGDSSPEREPDDPDTEFVEMDPSGRYGRVCPPDP